MKSRVLSELRPYLIAFASSAVPALIFTLLVRLWLMNEVFLRTLFTLHAWLGGAAALLSPLIITPSRTACPPIFVFFIVLLYTLERKNILDIIPNICQFNNCLTMREQPNNALCYLQRQQHNAHHIYS